MAKGGVSGGKVPDAIKGYLEAQYPGITGDLISYQVERMQTGETVVSLRLIYNDSKSAERADQ